MKRHRALIRRLVYGPKNLVLLGSQQIIINNNDNKKTGNAAVWWYCWGSSLFSMQPNEQCKLWAPADPVITANMDVMLLTLSGLVSLSSILIRGILLSVFLSFLFYTGSVWSFNPTTCSLLSPLQLCSQTYLLFLLPSPHTVISPSPSHLSVFHTCLMHGGESSMKTPDAANIAMDVNKMVGFKEKQRRR